MPEGFRPKTAERETAPERAERLRFATAVETRPSRNHPERNEDVAAAGDRWTVLCDGVGGEKGGEEAARAAATRIADLFGTFAKEHPDASLMEVEDMVADAVREANEAVIAAADRIRVPRAGTTVVASYVWEGAGGERQAVVAWLGNSRAYRRRADGAVARLTSDHDLLPTGSAYREADAAERRRMEDALDEAEYEQALPSVELRHVFDSRNILTRNLGPLRDEEGNPISFDPSVVVEPLADGDELWLVSDGVSGNLTGSRLAAALGRAGSFSERAQGLLDAATTASEDFSTERAHADDMTAVGLAVPPRS